MCEIYAYDPDMPPSGGPRPGFEALCTMKLGKASHPRTGIEFITCSGSSDECSVVDEPGGGVTIIICPKPLV